MYAFMIKQRAVLLIFLTHHMALPILKLVRSPEKFPYAAKDLQNFSDGTLGKDLVKFLDTKNLQLLTFYARHDMKHILLDYHFRWRLPLFIVLLLCPNTGFLFAKPLIEEEKLLPFVIGTGWKYYPSQHRN